MSRSTLPNTLAAYFAGQPLRPLGFLPNGRPVWPIAGGADDGPADGGGDGGDGKEGDGTGATDGKSTEGGKGYPDNTRPDDMTPDQQAAYWKSRSQTHEDRNRDLLKITGGKYGDDLRTAMTDLENLRSASLTDIERATAEAEKRGEEKARAEFGTQLVAAKFEAALAHVDDERRTQIIEGLNLSSYMNDGTVDTAKVQRYADTIAPKSAKEEGKREHDFGAGRRGDGSSAKTGSVAAVVAERRKAREKSSN